MVQTSNPSPPSAPLLWQRSCSPAALPGAPGRHISLSPPIPPRIERHLAQPAPPLNLPSLLFFCPPPAAAAAPPGKYLLVRDPNKPQLTLYAIPAEALDPQHPQFQDAAEGAGAGGEGEDEE